MVSDCSHVASFHIDKIPLVSHGEVLFFLIYIVKLSPPDTEEVELV